MPDPKDIARQWLETVLIGGALPDITAVVYMDQPTSDAPRPLLPYAGMIIEEENPQGWQTPYRYTEDTGPSAPPAKFPEYNEWVRQGQLLVMLYGDGSIARGRLLQLSLGRADVVELFQTEGVVIRHAVTMDNAREILDTTREERASVQFTVSWTDSISHDVDVIETVTLDYDVQ